MERARELSRGSEFSAWAFAPAGAFAPGDLLGRGRCHIHKPIDGHDARVFGGGTEAATPIEPKVGASGPENSVLDPCGPPGRRIIESGGRTSAVRTNRPYRRRAFHRPHTYPPRATRRHGL